MNSPIVSAIHSLVQQHYIKTSVYPTVLYIGRTDYDYLRTTWEWDNSYSYADRDGVAYFMGLQIVLASRNTYLNVGYEFNA